MRYSSAVVLSTLAAGSAAASNLHNRHASFHARRQAEAKRGDIDWSAISLDLHGVDWSKVNYGAPSAPAPAPSAAAPSSAPEQEPQYDATPAPAPSAVVKIQAVPSPSSAAPAPAQTSSQSDDDSDDESESLGDKIDDVVSDFLSGVTAIANKVGAKLGANAVTNNGGIWIGTDSPWRATFTNDASSEAVVYCWKADGFSGMSVNVNVPDISVGLKSGESVDLSFAANVPAACAPVFSDTKLAIFGGWDNTWFEVTFGNSGCFDVSRNVNMNGNTVHAQGSKCTSNMEQCVFVCKDPNVSSCEAGTDYELLNCNASNGGGGGYDPIMAGTGGGCAMGQNSEHVKISISH